MFKKHPIVKKAINDININIPKNCIGIHGKIYNMSNFNHPGGNTFIEINKGCDVTTLFETHHINYKLANKILNTLPVVGTYTPKINYNFTNYYKLKHELFDIFSTNKSRMMNNINKLSLSFYLFIAIYLHIKLLTYNYSNVNLYFYIICIFSSLFNSILGGFGHNGVHNLLYSSLLLDWNGLSSLEWLLEHAHSHHMYTNTIYDHDALSMQPFLNWIPSNENSLFNNKGKHLIFSIAEIVVPIHGNLIHRFRWSILFNKKFPIWLRLAPLIFIFRILSHILYQGLIFGIINLVICLSFAGYYFSYLAHLNHVNINNKNYENLNNVDFVEHQLKNTNDIKINNYLSHIFLNLNKQKMHHLFPTIDHCHLEKVYKIYNFESKDINYLNKELNNMLDKFSLCYNFS